jgi:CRP-like cAMP-binding protein
MDGISASAQYPLTGGFLAGRLRGQLSSDALARLESLVGKPRMLADGEPLIARGEKATSSTILVDGYMLRIIRRDDRRFIVSVHVPGDFVDLHGFALKRLDHDIVAAGPARIATVSHDRLREVTETDPELARALWFATLLDAAIHRQWIRNLEALDAPQRIAHLYAELHHRLGFVGRDGGRTLRTPFTQTDLADMCGVSAIHANRAVARIRELGLGEIRRGALYIGDWGALETYAAFDPAYLYGDGTLSL